MSTLWVRAAGPIGLAALLFGLNAHRDHRWMEASHTWVPVVPKAMSLTIKSPGTMEAVRVMTITSTVDEPVKLKHVREGQNVKAGQVLLELAQTSTRLEYNKQLIALRNADYDLEQARKNLSLQKQLYANQAVPLMKVSEAEHSLTLAEDSFKTARQQLELAKEKLKETTVYAPFAGVILIDYLQQEPKAKSDGKLYLLGDVSRFVVRARVDELDIPQVQEGHSVTIAVDAYPDRTLQGRVRSIAPQADREKKKFADVEVLIDVTHDGGVALKHNLSVQTYILLKEAKGVLAIPLSTLHRTQEGPRVLVRDMRGRLASRTVQLGRISQKEAEVVSGLEEGEQVGDPKKDDSHGRPGG